MDAATGVILIGRGSEPSDCPRELVSELKELRARRFAGGAAATVSPREAELDKKVREWPRTPETDPCRAGLLELADKLRMYLASAPLEAAFEESCAPSIEAAAGKLVKAGCRKILLATATVTRGGVHSEIETPEILKKLQASYPSVQFAYAWPYDPLQVAELVARNLRRL
jgi:sirohydrochlorin cobaltochelatase